MTTHSSILAWKISWSEEPGGLQSVGSQGTEQNWACTHGTARLCISPFPAYCILEVSQPFFILSCLCRPSVQSVSVSAEIVDWIHKPHPNCFLQNVLSHLFCIFSNMDMSMLKKIRQYVLQFSSVQSLSRVQLFATPWIAARQASLSITNSQISPKLICIELVMPSSHLILCCRPLLLPPILPSIKVFSNESTLRMRYPKYWSFSLSISPSNEHPGLISFRMDWLDLLAVQGTLKSLL